MRSWPRAFLFDHGEDLVFQTLLGHVVKALAGHGGVFDFLFVGEQRENRFHECRFSGGAGALDHGGERLR